MNILRVLFYGSIVAALVVVILFEAGVLAEGELAHDTILSYRCEYIMEISSICLIPLALKLFSFNKIKHVLKEQKEKALMRWGSLRILMLGSILVLNTLLYYLFVGVAFGYLAIIILIAMAFIVPTKSRCKEEIGD